MANKEHALLSASGAEKWFNCTPSARLEENFPETTSEYAEEGRLAHAVVELVNKKYFTKMKKSEYEKQLKPLQEHGLYHADMLNYAEGFRDFIKEEANSVKNPTLLFEQRLDCSTYIPESFGTGDVIIIGDDTIKIIDYKYGKGVLVEATDNLQLLIYALGAYDTFNLIYDFKAITATIYQPRLDNIASTESDVNTLLDWADTVLTPRAKLAFDGAGEYKPGDHCRFCRARASCRARAEENLKLQEYDYSFPDLLSLDEIADILKISDRLKNWVTDIEAYALEEALRGNKITGFKVVEGRSNRQYVDREAIEKILLEKGYQDHEIWSKKLHGIGEMENLLTRQIFDELLGPYISKPPGAPTLVLETDKRPEYSNAVEDFKNVDT